MQQIAILWSSRTWGIVNLNLVKKVCSLPWTRFLANNLSLLLPHLQPLPSRVLLRQNIRIRTRTHTHRSACAQKEATMSSRSLLSQFLVLSSAASPRAYNALCSPIPLIVYPSSLPTNDWFFCSVPFCNCSSRSLNSRRIGLALRSYAPLRCKCTASVSESEVSDGTSTPKTK